MLRLRSSRGECEHEPLGLSCVVSEEYRDEVTGPHPSRLHWPRSRRTNWRCGESVDLCDIALECTFVSVHKNLQPRLAERIDGGENAESRALRALSRCPSNNETRLYQPLLHAAERPLARARAGRSHGRASGNGHRLHATGRDSPGSSRRAGFGAIRRGLPAGDQHRAAQQTAISEGHRDRKRWRAKRTFVMLSDGV